MKILAISGSLRCASLNTALLQAMARLAPPEISVDLFTELGGLPLFNPDIEEVSHPVVASLHAQLLVADAVLIACPEYAHGITGAMKNALDWMVGRSGFVDKPVALINASPRAVHAQASLTEILTVMAAIIVKEASITVPILGSQFDESGIIIDPDICVALLYALRALQTAVDNIKTNT
ncbi:NADPH-dependent FMN reductase [Methylomonas sp. AM2-LC]|uniref:NADPH-dependent FMN reductase n=1 Tax=Methylomonas sp. AM2-LC TaxID=3153301 RepID=UPI0032650F47